MISLDGLFASVRLMATRPLPDPVSLRKSDALLGAGFSGFSKETVTGLWCFSLHLLIVLQTGSAVAWCMSVLPFQTSWLNPLTVCDWTVLTPVERFCLFCRLVSFVTPRTVSIHKQRSDNIYFYALFLIYNSFIHWNRRCLALRDLFLNLHRLWI